MFFERNLAKSSSQKRLGDDKINLENQSFGFKKWLKEIDKSNLNEPTFHPVINEKSKSLAKKYHEKQMIKYQEFC